MNTKLKPNLLPGVFLFIFLVLMDSLAIFLSQQPPRALPDSIPAAEFSAERAFQYVEALVREPLEKILSKHKLSLSGVANNPDFKLSGEILPVDALVVGNITSFYRFAKRVAWGGVVAYTGRMVNIRTEEFLFTIRCNTAQHYDLPEKVADDFARDAIKKLLEK